MTPTNPTKLRALADFVANGTERGSPEADRAYLVSEFGLSPEQAERVQRLAVEKLVGLGVPSTAQIVYRLKLIID